VRCDATDASRLERAGTRQALHLGVRLTNLVRGEELTRKEAGGAERLDRGGIDEPFRAQCQRRSAELDPAHTALRLDIGSDLAHGGTRPTWLRVRRRRLAVAKCGIQLASGHDPLPATQPRWPNGQSARSARVPKQFEHELVERNDKCAPCFRFSRHNLTTPRAATAGARQVASIDTLSKACAAKSRARTRARREDLRRSSERIAPG